MYAIVTDASYYDSYDSRCTYESFKTYNEVDFRNQVQLLTLSGTRFRAFRITPVTITTNMEIS